MIPAAQLHNSWRGIPSVPGALLVSSLLKTLYISVAEVRSVSKLWLLAFNTRSSGLRISPAGKFVCWQKKSLEAALSQPG